MTKEGHETVKIYNYYKYIYVTVKVRIPVRPIIYKLVQLKTSNYFCSSDFYE